MYNTFVTMVKIIFLTKHISNVEKIIVMTIKFIIIIIIPKCNHMAVV